MNEDIGASICYVLSGNRTTGNSACTVCRANELARGIVDVICFRGEWFRISALALEIESVRGRVRWKQDRNGAEPVTVGFE